MSKRGIFGGSLFGGLGQDMTFTLEESDAALHTGPTATTPGKPSGGGTAYIPPSGGKDGGATPAYIPGAAPSYALAPPDHTVMYVVGGFATLGLLGFGLMMMNSERRVKSNRGRRRKKRK